MMALRNEPSEHSLAALLYDRPQMPRLSREAVFAIAMALAVHGAFGLYIYQQKFEPTIFAPVDDPPVAIDMAPPPKVTPPPPPREVITPSVVRPVEGPVIKSPVEPLAVIATPVAGDPPVGPLAILADATPPISDARASPPAPAPAQRVIRNANWLTMPTPAQMNRLYPRQAAAMGVSGGATLMCDVAASGAVGNCSVIDESPKGRGFGAAALAGSRFFKMNPKTIDGKPFEGAKVRIPIIFNLAD